MKTLPRQFNLYYVTLGSGIAGLTLLAAGCASAPSRNAADPTWRSGQNGDSHAGIATEPKASGPAVVYVRPEPRTVELNRDFQPMHPAEVLADIKDFTAKVNEVKLQFSGIPLEIPMENVGGSTWRAQLTPRQLEMLAVSGQTIRYEAHVVARDEEGKVAQTKVPVEVAIKTPDLITGGVGAG